MNSQDIVAHAQTFFEIDPEKDLLEIASSGHVVMLKHQRRRGLEELQTALKFRHGHYQDQVVNYSHADTASYLAFSIHSGERVTIYLDETKDPNADLHCAHLIHAAVVTARLKRIGIIEGEEAEKKLYAEMDRTAPTTLSTTLPLASQPLPVARAKQVMGYVDQAMFSSLTDQPIVLLVTADKQYKILPSQYRQT